MPSELPVNDPRNVWQKQPTEAFKMSADQLRLKAQERQKGARSQVLRDAIIGLVLSVVFAWNLIKVNHVWWGLSHPLSAMRHKKSKLETVRRVADEFQLRLLVPHCVSRPLPDGFPLPLADRSEEHTSELQSLRHLVC